MNNNILLFQYTTENNNLQIQLTVVARLNPQNCLLCPVGRGLAPAVKLDAALSASLVKERGTNRKVGGGIPNKVC